MPELLTLQDLANGHLDVKALGEAATGDENTIVTTRTGETYPSAKRAINIMFQNGGLPAEPFATKAKMETDGASLVEGQLAIVYNETANNGLYVKSAGVWVKSPYDPVGASKSYADSNPMFKPKNILVGVDLNTIRDSGEYLSPQANTDIKLALNYPFEGSGVLRVSKLSGGLAVTQRYVGYGTFGTATRTTDGAGNFLPWKVATTNDKLAAEITLSKAPVNITSDNSVNLNTITTQGATAVYSTKPLAESHFPEQNVQGILLNYTAYSATNQLFLVRGTSKVYSRGYWGTNGWSAWELLVTQSQLNLELAQYKHLLGGNDVATDLVNPLKATKIKLIGDSITWGMGSSAGSPIEPRTGYLTDVRNTTAFTSKTWANLLRQWVAKAYGNGLITEDAPGSAYTQTDIKLSPSEFPLDVIMKNNAGVTLTQAQKAGVTENDPTSQTGEAINVLGANFPVALRPTSIEIELESDNIALLYQEWAVGDENDKVDIYVDDVLVDSFNYYKTTVNSKASKTITFPMGKHKIRLVNTATKATSYLRFHGYSVNKKTWVINEGIIGLSTATLLSRDILPSSLDGTEDLILFMLGTNDRAEVGELSGFKKRLNTSIDKMEELSPRAKIVLMSPSYANSDAPSSPYKFKVADANRIIAGVAKQRGLDFISHYLHTTKAVMKGEVILSDGLHLNDLGNELFFDAIVDKLFI